jgi:hypothetical protein
MADRIIKLVFLRVDSRKCVVPLVEGCDFQQFLHRVRRRLGLPDDALVELSDASGPVDSIDRLLEVDEGSTLAVHAPDAPLIPTTPASTGSASRSRPRSQERSGALGGNSPGGGGGAAADGLGAMPEVRVNVPNGSWARAGRGDCEEDETGALKYKKRRRLVSLARSSKLVASMLVLIGLGLGARYFLS